ncbi:MAG: FliM/FliN family flagellar motor switch protein [Rhodobacteraceae bacterium]|nr:FliM/FliN family flagellar motor switch protein [Paracoccaceae bacterium]
MNSILQQMLRPATNAPEADPAVDGLAGVLGKAASVIGLTALDVQLETSSSAARQCDAAEFLETLPGNGLFFRIECETVGQIGLLILDSELIDSINNVQTGELDDEVQIPRPPTDIDAAMCRPFLDAVFSEFTDILRELRGGKITDTYVTARVETEPSPHMFPETPYLQIGIDFDFMGGKAKGHLSLMIPSVNTEFTSTLPRPGESASTWREAFRANFEAAPASLNVVLHRKKLPIGQILKLKPGDMLDIPARALENLSIECQNGPRSRSLMQARLGEYQEMRAAKITKIGNDNAPSGEPKLLEPADASDASP